MMRCFILAAVVMLTPFNSYGAASIPMFDTSVIGEQAATNLACIRPVVIGSCSEVGWPPLVRYWMPELIVETTKRPDFTMVTSALSIVNAVTNPAGTIKGKVQSMAEGALKKTITGGISGIGGAKSSGNNSNLGVYKRFADAHVYNIPIISKMQVQLTACGYTKDFSVTPDPRYLSEDDVAWRLPEMDYISPDFMFSLKNFVPCESSGVIPNPSCIGTWAHVAPRGGHVIQTSDVTVSAVDAYRAVHILGPGVVPISIHDRKQPLSYMISPMDEWSLFYPIPSPMCTRFGTKPIDFFSKLKASPTGNHIWVYWRKRYCCAIF